MGYQMKTRWGRRPWIGDTVKKAIVSPIYLGHVTYKGQRFPGRHSAIIPQELWDKCQEVRHRNRRRARTFSPKFRTYLFQGMLICEGCGQPMTAETSRGEVAFYRCMSYFKQTPYKAPRWRVHESALEEQISAIIASLELPPDWRSRIEQFVNDGEDAKDVERERARLQKKMRRLETAYLEVMIDEAQFRQKRAKVEEALASLRPTPRAKIEVSATQLMTMRLAWESATKEERSQIIATLFEAVHCDPATKGLVAVEPKEAFRLLFHQLDAISLLCSTMEEDAQIEVLLSENAELRGP